MRLLSIRTAEMFIRILQTVSKNLLDTINLLLNSSIYFNESNYIHNREKWNFDNFYNNTPQNIIYKSIGSCVIYMPNKNQKFQTHLLLIIIKS